MGPRELIRGIALAAAAIVLALSGMVGQPSMALEQRCEDPLPGLEGTYTSVFNDPHSSCFDKQNRISRYLQWLIDGAEKGDEITVATYRFLDGDVSDKLLQAWDRDVNIRVLLNGSARPSDSEPIPWKCTLGGPGEYSEQYCPLRKVLGADRSKDFWISYCGEGVTYPQSDACIGHKTSDWNSGRPIMHNKFYLFSRTRGMTNVVVQTTSNLSEHSGPNMFNSVVAIAGKPELYQVYQDYFADLAKERKEPDYYEQNKPDRIDGQLEVNFSPRQSGNTPLDYLNKVDCPKKGKQTRIRVAAADIRGGTGAEIAEKLWDLDNKGCYVDIAADMIGYGKYSEPRTDPLRKLLMQPTGKYHGPDVREFSSYRRGVHEKNLLIDGQFEGKDQKVVLTGSLNFNNKSRYANDEIWLMIISDEVHDAFRQNFWDIRRCANLVWQASSPDRYWGTPIDPPAGCEAKR